MNTWHWQRVENPWQEPENTTAVFALNAWRGHLYLGTRNLHNGGEVLRSADGIHWHSIAAQGFGDAANRDIYGFVGFRTCSTPARITPFAATTTRSRIAAPRFGAAPAGRLGVRGPGWFWRDRSARLVTNAFYCGSWIRHPATRQI